MTEPGSRDDDAAMRARLAALSRDLGRNKPSKAETPSNTPSPSGVGQAISLGTRVVSEFVAAIIVASLVGWWLDRQLGTSPGLLILFVALGTAAGFWNVYRVATRTGAK